MSECTQWVDIGVNLTDDSFNKDRNAVIEQAFSVGVTHMIVTGTTVKESIEALELCNQYPGKLFCTAGIHPHYAKDHGEDDFSELASLCKEPPVVACGETGLDFNRNFSSPTQQISAFEKQLELAHYTQLPLFLHEREAHKTQLEMLISHRDNFTAAVAHCFTGTKEELYNYLDLDLYIGITGWVCDERRGQELQKLIKDIPIDRLLLETDAPYLLPRDLKPKPKSRRNLPKYLPHIANTIAQLRGMEMKELKSCTYENSNRLFKLA